MTTIYIMWLREMKKFFRNSSRIIGALGQPILFLLALGYGLGSVFQAAGQGNYIEFLAPGVIGMSIIFGSVFNGMALIWDRQFGFLKETLVAPVSRTNIMLGRTLGGATTAALQGIIVLVISLLFGFHPASWGLVVPAVLVMLLIGLLFNAIGLTGGALFSDFQGFQLIMNFLVMPLFFLSGSLFPLQGAPTALQWIARFDPLSYGIDALRALLINTTVYGVWSDVGILALVTVFFLGLSSYFFSRIQI
ncbi:MAG: ABC transporter permease [Patescibacteria group bacterium]|nr:ABC transporter permease [Patescibacteria group bacterium]